MILVKLDRNSSTPLYKQVVRSIIQLIDEGSLGVGESLPSSRLMAQRLGLNRSTIYRAYQELLALGYIKSVPGSYTMVRKRPKPVPLDGDRMSTVLWNEKSAAQSELIYKTFLDYSPEYPLSADRDDVINLSQLDLDKSLFPVEDFRRCLNQVLTLNGPEALGYGSCFGYPPLRETIANRLRIHGISVSSDEVLITSGAQQALELLLKLFTRPGERIVVESPTYANLLPLLRFYQVRVEEIPMKSEGMDLDLLENWLDSHSACFVYTIPNFQNPTGITTPQNHRERLLSLCEKYDVLIVEDGFEEEMKYFGKVVLPIKSMDNQGIVIYIGTFSKVLFPGIRVGWIAADKECIQRLTAIKRFSDISTNHVVQVALDQFLQMGYYDLNLRRLHRIFRRRMQVAMRAMEEHIPEDVSWTSPSGGYTIWVRLNHRVEESLLREFLMNYGVLVSPGSYYFYQGSKGEYFRISIAALNEEMIEEGIGRLGLALRDLKKRVE